MSFASVDYSLLLRLAKEKDIKINSSEKEIKILLKALKNIKDIGDVFGNRPMPEATRLCVREAHSALTKYYEVIKEK